MREKEGVVEGNRIMSHNLKVCSVDDGLKKKLAKFRFRKEKTNAAIVMKVDTSSMSVVEDDTIEDSDLADTSLEEVASALPAHLPRYIAYSSSYKHDDGRVSYPLSFIFVSPQGCKPELQMMYAGSKNTVVSAGGFTKVFEVRSSDELTEEWLQSKLSFFR